MTSKQNPKDIIKEFIDSILNKKENDNFEIISLEEINSMEIIDEILYEEPVDIPMLYDITIPKPLEKENNSPQKKKKQFSIAIFFFILFIIVVIAFFFFNPEVILGKNKNYICTKSYMHKTLPSSVNEEISLTFSGKSLITKINITTDYAFNNTEYYKEFKEKGYFYKYMKEGDTYKFIDDKYTYRVFSSVNTEEEYFLPNEQNELLSYYQNAQYICKIVDVDE